MTTCQRHRRRDCKDLLCRRVRSDDDWTAEGWTQLGYTTDDGAGFFRPADGGPSSCGDSPAPGCE